MSKTFFPLRPESNPTIYAYELIGVKGHENLLKVGYTSRTSKDRIAEQLKTSRVKYNIVLEESAMRSDGSSFTDFDVHRYLKRKGIQNPEGEWFKCTVKDVKAAMIQAKRAELLSFGTMRHNDDGTTIFLNLFNCLPSISFILVVIKLFAIIFNSLLLAASVPFQFPQK